MNLKRVPLFILLALPGCGVLECVDEKFEREVKPIDQSFLIELEFQNREMMSMQIQCEEYYDAMCAERGNYWAIREVGFENEYKTSAFQFTDSQFGDVKIPIPKCSDMVRGKKTPLEYILPTIAGDTYWLTSSKGNVHTYSTSKALTNRVNTLTVELTMKVNHVPIK